jgi:phthiocerol/phenolphthiocerol synthesis type-I polyketide synthase C
MQQPMKSHEQDIAIVAMDGYFPGADGPQALWELLKNGRTSVGPVPADRWDKDRLLDPVWNVPGFGAFLEKVREFDPLFFGISAREAAELDPQQRLLLEVVYRMLENAGVDFRQQRWLKTGVYVGSVWHDYELLRKNQAASTTRHSAVGQADDVLSSRLSYYFGFQGPSLTVHTGCSASLVALHLACEALRTGTIEQALVGGVNLILTPDVSIGLTAFGGLSAEGRCKAFDESADGFVRGEGVAALLLMPRAKAEAEGWPIRAIVAASAVNNDGGGDSFVSPNVLAQAQLLRDVYAAAGMSIDDIDYIETHGTGTKKGDPVEAAALGRIFHGRKNPLPIGSIKTNIGHLEGASGLAGVFKACLIAQHRVIPPSLHFKKGNPQIKFKEWNLEVVTESRPLDKESEVVVGVNSFGWGGTNAHVVIKAAKTSSQKEMKPAEYTHYLFPISAPQSESLSKRFEDLRLCLKEGPQHPADISYTLAKRTPQFIVRQLIRARDRDDLMTQLATGAEAAHTALTNKPVIAFVFPGQGSQWLGMCKELVETDPAFREAIESFDRGLQGLVSWKVCEILSDSESQGWLGDISIIQPLLSAVMIGLAASWKAQGITPHYVVGHSMGEVAAAATAGILSIEEAARLICIRSKLLMQKCGQGLMLLVDLGSQEAEAYIAAYAERVAIAVVNGPRTVVLSGEAQAIEELQALFESSEIYCKLIRVDIASHSPQMDSLLDPLAESLGPIARQDSSIQMLSTVYGDVLGASELDTQYWLKNLREPVRYYEAIDNLLQKYGVTHFVEISPHPVLKQSTVDAIALSDRKAVALETLRRDQDSQKTLVQSFQDAWTEGLPISWTGLVADANFVKLPAQTWNKKACWIEGGQASLRDDAKGSLHPIVNRFRALADGSHKKVSHFYLSMEQQPFLREHQVDKAKIAPLTLSLELFLAAAQYESLQDAEDELVIRSVNLPGALLLQDGSPAPCQMLLKPKGQKRFELSLFSGERLEDDTWSLQAKAYLLAEPRTSPSRMEAASLTAMLSTDDVATADAHYDLMQTHGYFYGKNFQLLHRLRLDASGVWACVQQAGKAWKRSQSYRLCPMMIDACLQAGLHALLLRNPGKKALPVGIEELRVHRRLPSTLYAHLVIREENDGLALLDARLYDEAGECCVSLVGLQFRLTAAQNTHGYVPLAASWVEQPLFDSASIAGRVLLLSKSPEAAQLLIGQLASQSEVIWEVGEPENEDISYGDYERVILDLRKEESDHELVLRILPMLQRLYRTAPNISLLVLTEGTQQLGQEAVTQPLLAGAWGLLRALRYEWTSAQFKLIDLDCSNRETARSLAYSEILSPDADEEVAWRGERRFVRRLGRSRDKSLYEQPMLEAHKKKPFRYVLPSPGQFENFGAETQTPSHLGPGEVEITVEYVGLNFVDALAAMGSTFNVGHRHELKLGGELSGVITRVGPECAGYEAGTPVIATHFGCLASHIKVPVTLLRARPAGLAAREGAAISLAYVTAWYALVKRIKTQPGQTILIHAASGGLGLATVEVARMLGLKILATAGSASKRQYLIERGVEAVFSSREGQFAEGVLAYTKGRGVDIVVNSLAGEWQELSLDITAPDGHFLELGKSDIYAERELNLRRFKKAISFHAIDLAGYQARDPEGFGRLLQEVLEQLQSGQLNPLPVQEFAIDELEQALRRFSHPEHIGKIVLNMQKLPSRMWRAPFANGVADAESTYLITGGLGGLGWAMVQTLVRLGAKHLIVISRSADKRQEEIAALREQGVSLGVWALDVSDYAALEARYQLERDSWPAMKGIFHAAGVLDDAMLENIQAEQFYRIWAPKVQGAWNLHALAERHGWDLDAFVLYSSAAALLGLPGQGLYCAANAALDALAMMRRSQGKAATAVNFPVVADVGLAAIDEQRGQRLISQGMQALSAEQVSADLIAALQQHPVLLSLCSLKIDQWLASYPFLKKSPMWSAWLAHGESSQEEPGSLRQTLAALQPEARTEACRQTLRRMLSQVMRVDEASLSHELPFMQMGLDSMMSLELRNRLEEAFETHLSPTILWTYPSINQLLPALLARIGLAHEGAEGLPQHEAVADAAAAVDLTEELANLLTDL